MSASGLGHVTTQNLKQRLETSSSISAMSRRKCSVSPARRYFKEIHSSDRSAARVFTRPGVTIGGRLRQFRLLLSNPEAVAQGQTCILQEPVWPHRTRSAPPAFPAPPPECPALAPVALTFRPSPGGLPTPGCSAAGRRHARCTTPPGSRCRPAPASPFAPGVWREVGARSDPARVRCPARGGSAAP
jgi:hypothetical protein